MRNAEKDAAGKYAEGLVYPPDGEHDMTDDAYAGAVVQGREM